MIHGFMSIFRQGAGFCFIIMLMYLFEIGSFLFRLLIICNNLLFEIFTLPFLRMGNVLFNHSTLTSEVQADLEESDSSCLALDYLSSLAFSLLMKARYWFRTFPFELFLASILISCLSPLLVEVFFLLGLVSFFC